MGGFTLSDGDFRIGDLSGVVFLEPKHTQTCIHVLMRDETEGRKKQARSNKQQGKATQAVTFPKCQSCRT